MARILVNYIYNKAKDEFKILDQDCVYADQQVAVLETEDEIRRPLIVPIRGNPTVVDRDRYEAVNKIFFLTADDKGIVREDPKGTPIWLPRDTDVSKLRLQNGQLVMIEEEPKKETPKEEPKPASKKRKAN